MSVLETWGMCCPRCEDDAKLTVTIVTGALLTADGTDATEGQNGDHEWDSKSACICACGWCGIVDDAEKAGTARKAITAAGWSYNAEKSEWRKPDTSQPDGYLCAANILEALQQTELRLYFIAADDMNGENRDLFVWATTQDTATTLWRKFHGEDIEDLQPGWIFVVPTKTPEEPIAMPWHDPESVDTAKY